MAFRLPWLKKPTAIPTKPEQCAAVEIETVKDFNYWADRYLTRKKRQAVNTYKQAFFIVENHLKKSFGPMHVGTITTDDIEAYLDHKIDVENLKVSDHIKHFRAIMKLAKSKKEDVQDFEFKNPDPTTFVGKAYTRTELARLMWHARPNRNLRFQIYLSYQHGLRRSECVHLNFNDLDLEKGVCALAPHKLKTKDTINRRFHLNAAALRILRARYIRYGHSTGHVFVARTGAGCQLHNCSSWQRLRMRSKVHGRFHDLRHTCVSRMVESNVPITFIQIMLGLGPDMVKRYSHVPENISKAAVNIKEDRKNSERPWLVLLKNKSIG